MKRSLVATSSIGLFALLILLGLSGQVKADGPEPTTATPAVPAPAMPTDLAGQVREITEAVLENHIDPPARQQMILAGIKALARAAGVPTPPGLGRRVSEVATPEQLAALLEEVWPGTTAKPVAAKELEEALLAGLLDPVPGGAELMTAKERNAAEQIAGNRYVGILVALSRDEGAQRPVFSRVMKGGPAARAGVKDGDLFEEVDGVDTKGMELREVVERTRGDEGTDVVIKVRSPGEAKARTLRITRGRLASDQLFQATVVGLHRGERDDGTVRLDGPDPIGYLRLTGIGASTPHELRKRASRMESEGVRAVVIDLRGAGAGGTASGAHAAVLVADSLLEGGTIGRVRTVRGATIYRADSDALFRGWPIAVLVDHDTSGAAAWIAAALQDNHRATIIGWPGRGGHRAGAAPGRRRERGPRTDEGAVRSTVAIGDGRRWIAMRTGTLERGDGRPLVDRDGTPADAAGRDEPRGGVQPDRSLPATGPVFPHPSHPLRTPDPKAGPPTGPAEGPGSAIDPALNTAVKVLHEALARS